MMMLMMMVVMVMVMVLVLVLVLVLAPALALVMTAARVTDSRHMSRTCGRSTVVLGDRKHTWQHL